MILTVVISPHILHPQNLKHFVFLVCFVGIQSENIPHEFVNSLLSQITQSNETQKRVHHMGYTFSHVQAKYHRVTLKLGHTMNHIESYYIFTSKYINFIRLKYDEWHQHKIIPYATLTTSKWRYGLLRFVLVVGNIVSNHLRPNTYIYTYICVHIYVSLSV